MRKRLLLPILMGVATSVFSQTISGKVENINGKKIFLFSIVTKDSTSATNIKEYLVGRDGLYSITLLEPYKKLVVEATANRYRKDVYIIDNPDPLKQYVHDFVLSKDTIVKLPEVFVSAKQKPFQIKSDTVIYNVSAYADGTERKIQDVIKKMPGMEVNEKTGEIRYKGKPVETVKLDGDDIFASNYAIGTKNINVGMVGQVEAIENYSSNPLLKGLEAGDKVALNLKLKKGKTDYSGDVDLGTGLLGSGQALDLAGDVLGISSGYKSFATLSYNNVGINNTPYDYFSYQPAVQQIKEEAYIAKRYIPETYFNSEIDPERSNMNHTTFGSYNSTFKLGSKLGVKANLFYMRDRLDAEQSTVVSNSIEGQHFKTTDLYSIIKQPTQYRGEIEVKQYISRKSLFEFSSICSIENINTNNGISQNDSIDYHTELQTKGRYFKQEGTYTNKVSKNRAVQLVFRHSIDSAPQNYSFLPAIFDANTFTSNRQISGFWKKSLGFRVNLLGSSAKSKFSLALGFDRQRLDFTSELRGSANNHEQIVDRFNNTLLYKINNTYLYGLYREKVARMVITPVLSISYLCQNIANKQTNGPSTAKNLLIEPSVSVSRKVGRYATLLFGSGFRQKPFSEEYLVGNPIYLSNRSIKSNEVGLYMQKSITVNSLYILSNLYHQFQLSLSSIYSQNSGNFFTDYFVQQNSTQARYFFLPEVSRNLSIDFMVEKYVPFLHGTARLKSGYALQSYKNIVNHSFLRDNTTQNATAEFFFKTALGGRLNFQNTVNYQLLSTKSNDSLHFSNKAVSNNFQVIAKPFKRALIILSTDYFLPNTKSVKDDYFFIDLVLNYETRNKLYNLRFRARNISNNKIFKQFSNNDYSTIEFRTNLLPSIFVLNISRNF